MMPREEMEDLKEEKVLLEWTAPERAFQRRDRDFWITAVAILVLVAVILIFIKEFFLIIALGSILFLYYVMSTVPPENIKNKLTNRGVYFGEARYEWIVLRRFWFKKSLSSLLLAIETNLRFPRQIMLVIDSRDQEKIKELVVKRIPMLEESPTFVDRLTKRIASALPLEDRKKDKLL
jgi:hypothetical protein